MDAEYRAYLELALSTGIGPQTIQRLLETFGSPREVLAANSEQLLNVDGIGPRLAALIRQRDKKHIDDVLRNCEQYNIQWLLPLQADFPELLRTIPDPPSVLFYKGELSPRDQLSVAIIGTRHATQYGKDQAARICYNLAKAGFTLVSGLARGIDAIAHETALRCKARTIAVLANGLDTVYPPENKSLAERIVQEGGLLLSEQPPCMPPKRGMFPQRNRLISGLALGVLVIEAARRSGTLITARHAAEQGRDVFALPGPVQSRVSQGCHQLIRDGAILTQDADDIIESLGPMVQDAKITPDHTIRRPAELQLNDQEKTVLNSIEFDATDIDRIIHRSGLPVARVLSTLSVLESKHLVRRSSGRCFLRC
jgi:DNA processing protein